MVMLSERQITKIDEAFNRSKNKFLTFRLGNENYGIEAKYVTEILGIQKITEIPDMYLFIKGVINLRGRIIPVIDLRLRFNMQERPYDERTCIMIVRLDYSYVGIIVDEVNEVIEIPEYSIESPSNIRTVDIQKYMKGIGKIGEYVQILIDVDKLLNNDDEI